MVVGRDPEAVVARFRGDQEAVERRRNCCRLRGEGQAIERNRIRCVIAIDGTLRKLLDRRAVDTRPHLAITLPATKGATSGLPAAVDPTATSTSADSVLAGSASASASPVPTSVPAGISPMAFMAGSGVTKGAFSRSAVSSAAIGSPRRPCRPPSGCDHRPRP